MGQYRQWLHYRHIDRQLQAQREQLLEELARLRASISALDTSSSATDNHIIQALLLYAKAASVPERTGEEHSLKHNPEIISQTLFEHNRLTDFDQLHQRDSNEVVLSKNSTSTYSSPSPAPHEEINSAPESMNHQQDEQTPTEPQVALPWWLQKSLNSDSAGNTLDAQNMRTNQLVQRWLERWGRQAEQEQHRNTNGTAPEQERQSS